MISIRYVQFVTAREFDVPPEIMSEGVTRLRREARPRQVAMLLASEFTKHSTVQIGVRFGGRHHTTVIHALRKTRALMLEHPDLGRKVNDLRKYLASVTDSSRAFAAERDAASAIGHALNNGPVKFPIAKEACARVIGRFCAEFGKFKRARARRRCVWRHTHLGGL